MRLSRFRADRIKDAERIDRSFKGEGDRLRKLWTDGWNQDRPDTAN